MKLEKTELTFQTSPREIKDITESVQAFVAEKQLQDGICSLYVRHTSASLVVQEVHDPAVVVALGKFLEELVVDKRWQPEGDGPDLPAHLRAATLKTSETLPVRGGKLGLGGFQRVLLCEQRLHSHDRTVVVTLLGQ